MDSQDKNLPGMKVSPDRLYKMKVYLSPLGHKTLFYQKTLADLESPFNSLFYDSDQMLSFPQDNNEYLTYNYSFYPGNLEERLSEREKKLYLQIPIKFV